MSEAIVDSQYDFGEFLYREFCNHIYLGQWELARACALSIHQNYPDSEVHRRRVRETLTRVSENPYLVKDSWSKFPTPSYVSFLSSSLQLQICDVEDRCDDECLRPMAEFNVMLEEQFAKLSEWQIQELAQIYSALLKEEPNATTSRAFFALSSDTSKYIRTTLTQDPSVILLLLNQLKFPTCNRSFQNLQPKISEIVFGVLHHCLKQTEASYLKDHKTKYAELLPKCYTMLRLLPEYVLEQPTQQNKTAKRVDDILELIVSLCRSSILKQSLVYSSLLCRNSCRFIQLLVAKEEECCIPSAESRIPTFLENGSLDLEQAALWSLKTKCHFLEAILDFATKEVLAGNFSDVCKLFGESLLVRLLPLILILCWSMCEDDSDFGNVMQATKIWQPSEKDDPSLVETFNKFLTNVSFKERCVEYYTQQFPDAAPSMVIQTAQMIFKQLQTQAPLGVLQTVFGLKNLNPDSVLRLLNCSSQDSSDLDSTLQNNLTSLAAMRDSIVFHGYLAITLVMEAILCSCEISQLIDDPNFDIDNSSLKTSTAESFVAYDTSNPPFRMRNSSPHVKEYFHLHGAQDTYEKYVLEPLKKAKYEIKWLYPVTYRIEMLENIFSLLLVSSKDFYESLSNSADSDEGHEGDEKRSNSSVKEVADDADQDFKPNGVRRESFITNGRFVVRRVKLRDAPRGENSEHYSGSTGSSSSSSISTNGFLCSNLIVSDLLLLLKDAILEANVESFKARKDFLSQSDNKASASRRDLNKQIVDPTSSVEIEEVQKRTTQLMQYVDEAYWRYRLVKSGPLSTIPYGSVPSSLGDLSAIGVETTHSDTFQESKFTTFAESVGSSTFSGTDNADGSESAVSKHKKRRKHKRRLKSSISYDKYPVNTGIILRMLSPPDALLRQCLWQQNEEKAMEVVKLYGLENSMEAQELKFAKQVDQLCEKMNRMAKGKERFDGAGPSQKSTKSSMSDIVAIASAASSGLQSTMWSAVIEQEMNLWDMPSVSEIIEGRDVMPPAEKSLLAGVDNLCSVTLADMAFTRRLSMTQCVTFLEMALQQWKDTETTGLSQKKSFSYIPGSLKTIQMFIDLLKSFHFFFTDYSAQLGPWFFPRLSNMSSFSESLVNYIGPLDKLSFMRQLEAWKQFSSHANGFQELYNGEVDDQCHNPSNQLHGAYKELLQITKDLCKWSTELIRPLPVKYKNYLKKLYVYLQQVTGTLLGCKDQNISVGLPTYTSYFSVLRESPAEILRKMIEQKIFTQQKIEKFADGMKVDLGHVLLEAYFPRISLVRERMHEKFMSLKTEPLAFLGQPALVLNKLDDDCPSPRHPDLVARELLKDLVSMAQDVAMARECDSILTPEALLSLSRHSELSSWIHDSSEIAHVDLDLLRTPEEQKAFFINVTNLAWMHALLLSVLLLNENPVSESGVESEDSESNSKGSSFVVPPLTSPHLIQRVMQQKAMGYCIGQLGFVSLFDLRYNILHSSLPVPKHLSIPPYNQLFHHFSDLPANWVKYMPKADSRLLFALCEGMLYSPKLQVMYSDMLSDQLDEAMKDFINFSVVVDAEDKVVELPQLIDFYSLDFDSGKDVSNLPYEGLLNFFVDFMHPSMSRHLDDLLAMEPVLGPSEKSDYQTKKMLPFQIHVYPLLLEPGFRLDYSVIGACDGSNLPYSIPEDIMLNYLNNRCPLIADLYKIMSGHFQDCDSDQYSLTMLNKSPVAQLLKQRWEMTSDCSKEQLKPGMPFGWFVSSLSPKPLTDFTMQEIQYCMQEQSWGKALRCIDLLREVHGGSVDPSFTVLRQLLLQFSAGMDSGTPWTRALCISDPIVCAKTVLHHINKWPKGAAIESIKYCLCNASVQQNQQLYSRLQARLREIEMYQKIVDASVALRENHPDLLQNGFTSWQDVEEKSVWDQSLVIKCIRENGDYQLAVDWSKLHAVDSSLKLTLCNMKIVWYLKQTPPQLDEVLKIIDSCTTSECIQIVDTVLHEIPCIDGKLHLVQFLVNRDLEYEEQCHYLNMTLGFKMLKAASPITMEQYGYLVSSPHLLVEQLLMNVEVETAEKALKAISEDLNSDSFMCVSLSPLSINRLLETYASKALELPLLDDTTDSITTNITIVDSDEISSCIEHFVMPPAIPTRAQWVPDSRVHICQCCKQEQFNMFSRRHHCRRCGRVVCADCSQSTLVLEGHGKYGVKVCDDCYRQTMSHTISGCMSSPFKSSSFDKRYQMLSSMVSSGVRHSPLMSDFVEVKRRASSMGDPWSFCWVLTTNSEQDEAIRHDFFYDSAPSVSLCLSILKLHSNPGQCAKFMLGLCDRLINKIRPKSSGKQYGEVDYYLVLSMIRTFLVNAQLKYHHLLDHEGEDLVDMYFQRLEIIKMLVNSNCTHLIPKEDLIDGDTKRKLCDKALGEERMALALEICTNCGLDKTGVWSTWGFFCLRAGDWPAAREKFKHFLKVPKSQRQSSQESPSLNSIISFLEKCKYPGQGKAAAIHKMLSLREGILKGNTKVVCETETFNEEVRKECLYYLNTYGSHFSTVAFFQRQELVAEAFTYILSEKCDPEVFVEAMFMPMLKNSQLPVLLQHLNVADRNLLKSWPYLLSTCRFLQRIGYSNVLYQIQLFMEDYIRAAKSSIAFYTAPAASHSAVYSERSRYLHNAKKHFETYLTNSRSSTKYLHKNKNVLTLSESEVESYIKTIKLQEELIHYFKSCDAQNLPIFEGNASASSADDRGGLPEVVQPLTLFGNPTKKSQLASMVLVNAVKIDEGFDLCVRIIKEYHLSSSSVICSAAQEVVRRQWLDHLPHFLQNIKCCFQGVKIDDIVLECISGVVKKGGDPDFLIKQLSSDASKVNAYLISKKLKNAYLLAIKRNRPQDVRRVMKAAEQSGQDAVKKFCERWLSANAQKMSKD